MISHHAPCLTCVHHVVLTPGAAAYQRNELQRIMSNSVNQSRDLCEAWIKRSQKSQRSLLAKWFFSTGFPTDTLHYLASHIAHEFRYSP